MAKSDRRRVALGARLRYEFDKSMSAGPIALIGWLAVISTILIAIAAAVIAALNIVPDNGEHLDFFEAMWASLMRTLDAGTMGADTGWAFRIVMLAVTIGGIFVVSTLIGVLSSGIEGKLDQLRKGRSKVLERGHTIILNWSPSVFDILKELSVANESRRRPRVVIMADKDKVEMEDEIRAKVGDTKNTLVVCRSGNPIDLVDLEIVNPHAAKSIVILSPDDTPDADSQVIKMILAMTNNPNRRAEPYHIVAEIRDEKNMEIAELVGKAEVKLILSSDVIARITVQTCRQVGLSVVYKELLDYDGDEIYFQEEPKLVGKTFGEALFAYEHCSLMGLRFAAGGVRVNPPMETVIQNGDKIIAIAEDDDKVIFSGFEHVRVNAETIRSGGERQAHGERILILGWNKRGRTIVRELDNYVGAGSYLKIVADTAEDETQLKDIVGELENLTVEFETGDTTDRRLLNKLELTSFRHIVILCYAEQLDAQAADAKTMMTLLHLRDIEEKNGEHYSIVSEMIDVRNRALAEIAKADDFIVSDELTGLLLTQISENAELLDVFNDLFDADGSEIYLKPAQNYVALDTEANFYTVLEAARRRGEIAIGYRLERFANDADRAYGVKVNPAKPETVVFKPEDKIIVLAED